MDQFQVMFQELMSDIPADLMNSVRNGAQLSDADNEKLMTAVMSVYKAHQNEIKDMFLSYSFILFIVVPFFSIIIPVIWMVFRSVRALNALSKGRMSIPAESTTETRGNTHRRHDRLLLILEGNHQK